MHGACIQLGDAGELSEVQQPLDGSADAANFARHSRRALRELSWHEHMLQHLLLAVLCKHAWAKDKADVIWWYAAADGEVGSLCLSSLCS